MNLILFGAPGSGKGTQTDFLVRDHNFFKISTGDLLREEIINKTTLGEAIKKKIDEGGLVSDEIINSLIEKLIFNKKTLNNFVFDGYPRNIVENTILVVLSYRHEKVKGLFKRHWWEYLPLA